MPTVLDSPNSETVGRPKRFFGRLAIAALVANVVVVAALLWATTERLHVTVIVTSGTVTGTVGPVTVPAAATDWTSGQVGFFLQGSDPRAPVQWSNVPLSTTSPGFSQLAYRLGTESSWTNVQIKSLTTNQSLIPTSDGASTLQLRPQFGDWFTHPLGGQATATPGLSLVGSANWQNYQIDADLLRPRNAAGILVLSPDGANGMLFYFRPEDRDLMWYNVRDGQWLGPVATAPFRSFALDPVSGVQDVLRLILGGYPAALLVIGLVLGLGALESRARFQRDPPLPHVVAKMPRDSAARVDLLPRLTAVVIVLAGLALTLYVADAILQRMPHVQDSVAYLFQAETFAIGRLWVPTPAHPEFFVQEFIVQQPARWFSKYPPGWPMLLALGVLAKAPWVVNPICAALSLWLLYRIGCEIYRTRVGLLAAGLALTAPFFIFLSGSMMSHTSGLLFTLLMTWSFWRATRSDRPVIPAAIAGAAFGMLFLIRPYSALMVVFPLALYGLLAIIRSPTATIQRYGTSVIAALPFVLVFFGYNKIFTGSWTYPPQQLWWPFDSVGFGPTHGPWGFGPIDALNNTSRNLSELLEHGFGWPLFLTLALAMVPFVARRARTWDWLFLLGFIGLIVGYGFWWADGIMYGPRFYFEGFGFLILLTARGVDVLLDLGRWGTKPRASTGARNPASLAPTLTYAFIFALVAYNLVFYMPGQWQLYHGYNYVNRGKLDAVDASGIHNALIFADVGQSYEWWEYGMVFSGNDPLLRGNVIYARDLGDAADRKLIADFPGRSYYRLQGTTLTSLDLSANAQSIK